MKGEEIQPEACISEKHNGILERIWKEKNHKIIKKNINLPVYIRI